MKVEVLSSINSGEYKKGDVADFSDEAALELIAAGAAQSLEKEEAGQPEQPQVETPEVDHTEVTPSATDQPTPAAPETTPSEQPTAEQIQGDLDNLEPPLEAPVAPEAPEFPPRQPEQPQV